MKRWIFLALLLSLPGCLLWPPSTPAMVADDNAADRYTANGSTTAFAYNFKVFTTSDIEVVVDSTVMTLTTHYTVSGAGDASGGTVTFLTAPANNAIVTLLRKQPASQLSDYVPNEAFPANRIEKDLDKLVMQVQQLREEVDRALKFAKLSALVDQSVDEPTVGAFARGKSGGGIDWATPTNAGALSSPVAVADGGTGATSASTARTNLGVTDPVVGVWTPSVGGSATYSAQTGTYVKLGTQVTVKCNLVINSIGTGSTTSISGLPFTVSGIAGEGAVRFVDLSQNVVYVIAHAAASGTTVILQSLTAAGVSIGSNAIIGNGTSITFTLTYTAA